MSAGRRAVRTGLTALAVLVTVPAAAQLSPGELAAPHAALEGSAHCLDCHAPGRGVAPEKCLACHGALRTRIRAAEGLHARAEYARCETCHIEHHGRDFALVYWGDADSGGRDAFDHRLTGWPLQGAHREAACRECHRPENLQDVPALVRGNADPATTFLGLGTACLDCHVDAHRGQLGPSCTDCHTQASWRPAPGFDHDRTGFALTGRHRDVACTACHATETTPRLGADAAFLRFRPIAHDACADCHRDPHAGRLGADCATCHTTAGWRGARSTAGFDHDRTRFALRGAHRDVACRACHGDRPATSDLAFARCADCHRDPHGGALRDRADGGACESCHTVAGFAPSTFTVADHQRTRFPLVGAHLAVPCDACHVAAAARAAPVATVPAHRPALGGGDAFHLDFAPDLACSACHRDPHAGDTARVASACTDCHTTASWRRVTGDTFDHGAATGFPLDGAHRAAACADCHRPAAGDPPGEIRFAATPTDCAACHTDPHPRMDDVLADGTPFACRACHTTATFAAGSFDHARTGFRLEGGHAGLACTACHRWGRQEGRPVLPFSPLPTTCEGCHTTSPPSVASSPGRR